MSQFARNFADSCNRATAPFLLAHRATRADDAPCKSASTALPPHGYKSAWWKYPRAQHQLHRAQIRPALQQMRGEAVPQHMRRQRHAQSRPAAHTPKKSSIRLPGSVPPPRRFTNSVGSARLLSSSNSGAAPRADTCPPLPAPSSHRHDALLVALADATHATNLGVQVAHAQARQFRDAQTRGIQHFQHRPVAQPQRRVLVRLLQQLFHFLQPQIARQRPPNLRRFQIASMDPR